METAVSVKALEPGLLHDFLDFFDRRAFADNRDWSACYCRFFHAASLGAWERLTGNENRAAAARDIAAGRMRGYLAYANGRAIGWCAVDSKSAYPMLANLSAITGPGDEKVAAIVCLIVEKDHRRMGIALSLVEAAIDGARKSGFLSMEAYPRRPKDGAALSDAEAYPGPRSLYARLGFAEVREAGDRNVVSLKLSR